MGFFFYLGAEVLLTSGEPGQPLKMIAFINHRLNANDQFLKI